jgi:divalent metal cation (Fe/Co/Zn/Cd) transporter
MIAVLCYTISCELGVSFLKKPLVEKLHDKTISADARMNRADWMTGVTGIIGVAGIGFGLWWLDSVAACLIAIEIIRDGWENLRDSVTDLMDQVPTKATESEPEGWADKLKNRMSDLDWVGEVDVRLREEGNVITGEVFVVPKTTEGFEKRSGELQDLARDLDWRFYDLSLIAVEKL